jgi:hypothetical protein
MDRICYRGGLMVGIDTNIRSINSFGATSC